MKSFFKTVLATMLGLLLFQILGLLIVVIVVAGIAASGGNESSYTVESGSVLHLKLDQALVERGNDNPLANFDWVNLQSNQGQTVQELLVVLHYAAKDPNLQGVFLDLTEVQGDMTQRDQIREGLERFKRSGKWIIAHSESYSQGTLLLASMAKPLSMVPTGMAMFNGLATEPVFLKGMFEKLDMEIELIRVGKYKSAGEMLVRENLSEDNRYQQSALVQGVYGEMLLALGQNRGLHPDTLRRMANEALVQNAAEAVATGLIDTLMYRDQVLDWIKRRTKAKSIDKIKWVTESEYLRSLDEDQRKTLPGATPPAKDVKNKIAVIYAEGDIVSGEGGEGQIGGDGLSAALRKARLDKKTKAVVLRVNSPGGSALASDIIWRETQLIKDAGIPLVVSMGGVAASGGYYIAAAADSIFASPNTITGSIGVFGLVPYVGDFMKNKLGITVDRVTTGPYADIMSLSRRMRPDERAIIQKGVDQVYQDFVTVVAKGRGLSQDSVHSLAQGRVYTGRQAMALGLVDRMGGLNEAIACAARLAKVSSYRLRELPEIKDPVEELVGQLSGAYTEHQLRNEWGPLYRPYQQVRPWIQNAGVQARLEFVPQL
ncbi:MAG: signal peptide peptidase SppA [Bacteroidia bacterium]